MTSQHKVFLTERKWWLLILTSISFVKKEKLSLIFSEKRPLVMLVLCTNFNSFIPETYKTSSIKSWLCSDLNSDIVKIYHKINILKNIFLKNSHPRDFFEKCVKELTVLRVLTPKTVACPVPKKDLKIVLPYLWKTFTEIRTRINHALKNTLPYCNLRILFWLSASWLIFSYLW